MKLKRLKVTIRHGKAKIVAYGHAARGAERVLGVVETPMEELDQALKKKANQDILRFPLHLDE